MYAFTTAFHNAGAVPVTHRAKRLGSLRQTRFFRREVQNPVLRDVSGKKDGILHMRVENRSLLSQKMNHLDGIASLPEQMAQIAVRADFFPTASRNFISVRGL